MENWQDNFLPHGFSRRQGVLFCEDVDLGALSNQLETPFYVYSQAHYLRQLSQLSTAFTKIQPHFCYAMKANDNIKILSDLASAGTGFDLVSGGELRRVIAAGGDPSKSVFSGVGKTDAEIRFAIEAGIRCLNIESEAEGRRIAAIADELEVKAPVAVRVNPDVDPKTHPYISTGMKKAKFGISVERAAMLYQWLHGEESIEIVGIDCHIGSQLLDVQPVLDALDRVLSLVDRLEEKGIRMRHIDLGGGLGIQYSADDTPPDVECYAQGIEERLSGRELDLILEPGRFIVGNCGVLITSVLYEKSNDAKHMAVVDASMSELMRPALYQAFHDIVPLQTDAKQQKVVDIVGPVCESSDVLGSDRTLPALESGDKLVVLSAGAYGSTMANTYNTRPRPAEILISGDQIEVLRDREAYEDMLLRDQNVTQIQLL